MPVALGLCAYRLSFTHGTEDSALHRAIVAKAASGRLLRRSGESPADHGRSVAGVPILTQRLPDALRVGRRRVAAAWRRRGIARGHQRGLRLRLLGGG